MNAEIAYFNRLGGIESRFRRILAQRLWRSDSISHDRNILAQLVISMDKTAGSGLLSDQQRVFYAFDHAMRGSHD